MCGIAGIIGTPRHEVDVESLSLMTNALAHRGPDGNGIWIAPDARIGLGHRRLAIIDLDAAAAQPMASHDGTLIIVFNGEIYNHRALRAELTAQGHVFRTRSSDTEALLEGYRAWGIDGLLERIDGIYSFALHDIASGRTHLVRDRFGIKPLYVAALDGALAFASELSALICHAAAPREAAARCVAAYLTFMAVPAPETMIAGVWKVPAGHRLETDWLGGCVIRRFASASWRDPRQLPIADRAEAVAAIRARIEADVESQLVADVPVGVMLSGGLDSSTILAVASRRSAGLDAFTAAFVDGMDDETEIAARTARRFGARHHALRLSADDILPRMDAIIAAMDEPQSDWVCAPLWMLSREIAGAGGKVVLVGEGADEQFAGYGHWRPYIGWISRLASLAGAAGPLGRVASRLAVRLAGDDLRLLTRADFLDRASRGGEMFWGGAVMCWPLVRDAIWRAGEYGPPPRPPWSTEDPALATAVPQEDAGRQVDAWYADVAAGHPQADRLTRMIGVEFLHRLPELLLMRVDKMTMAHGVEARVPFLSRGMVELSFRIPGDQKLAGAGTKALMREALQGLLPDDILNLPKTGFGAPVDRWIRGPFGTVLRDVVLGGPLSEDLDERVFARMIDEHARGARNHAGMLWALFVLSRWLDLKGARMSR